MVDAFDFIAEAGGEILFVTDHDVDVFGDFTVNLLGVGLTAVVLPQGGAVIEIVGGHGAMLFGAAQGLDGDFGVVFDSAAKIPPQWNQRTPSTPKICSQSMSPTLS